MKWLDVSCLYRDDAVLVLQHAFDEEKGIVDHCGVIPFKELRCDDDVGDSSFIFETKKYESFGRSRALTNDHGSSHANN